MRFLILQILLQLPGGAASGCPIESRPPSPYYGELYGGGSAEFVLSTNTRILGEERNLRAALGEIETQQTRVTRVWPGKAGEHELILEDSLALRADRSFITRRKFRFVFTGSELKCVTLEYTQRDVYNSQGWVRKTAVLDPRTLEMEVRVEGYLASDSDADRDRVSEMAPHLRIQALERMTRYLREARYAIDMKMARAQDNQFRKSDTMTK